METTDRTSGGLRGRTVLLVLVATGLLMAAVAMSVDWSPAARRDPARLLIIGPLLAAKVGRADHAVTWTVVDFVVFLIVGGELVVAGLLMWRRPAHDPTGLMMVLGGLLWIVCGLRRSSDPALFTVGTTLTDVPAMLGLYGLLVFPSGRVRKPVHRLFFGVCVASATVGAWGEWAWFDPRRAFGSSEHDLLTIGYLPGPAAIVQWTNGVLLVVLTVTLTLMVLRQWQSGSPAFRSRFAPQAISYLFLAALFTWCLTITALFPRYFTSLRISWTFEFAAMLVPVPLLVRHIRDRLAHAAVGAMLVDIGDPPVDEGFVDTLRRMLRDPALQLWRYSPETGHYRDNDGHMRNLSSVPPDRVIRLDRGHTPLGALIHSGDENLLEQPDLLAAVAGATTLVLEQERLHAELREQLVEVRESRRRIVAEGDVQRRRIERDLHDGAQQRLVATQILLSRAQRAGDDAALRELVTDAAAELDRATAELRELARGVFPPALAEAGLIAALTALAERTPVPVEIIGEIDRRPAASVELAAYFIAAESITNAVKYSRATAIEMDLHRRDHALHVIIADNGCGGAIFVPGGGLTGLTDRAEALGGRLEVHSPLDGGTRVTAVLPCPER